MSRSRGRQDTSRRGQDNASQRNRGAFEQTGSGYRYDDEQRRFGNPSQRRFGGDPGGQESWRQPSERWRYSEGRDYGPDYEQESRYGRGQDNWRGGRSQEWSPERSYNWGTVGRADWGQGWNRGRDYEGDYETRYGRNREDYGYGSEERGEGGYEPGDYSYSGRSDSDWSSGMRGSYGQGSQQGLYGPSSSNEPWREGSYQGANRGVTRGSFGQGSSPGRSQQSRRQGLFAGRGPQGYKRSDDRIKEDVNEALTQDPDIDATNIQVEVQNGEVTLKGTVPDREAKRSAEDCAESCPGVRDVQNQLRVKREDESETETSKRDKGDDKRSHRQPMAS